MATTTIPSGIIRTAEARAAEQAARTKALFESAIQEHVDAVAVGRNYRDGFALASYAASTVPAWAAEASAFVAWRDAVWVYAYAELAKVMAGEREVPTAPAFLTELPSVSWPAPEE